VAREPLRALVLAALAVVAATAAPRLESVRGSVRVGDRPEPHAVVWIDAPASASSSGPAPERARLVLDQRNLAFSPRVLAVQAGDTVEFPNNDRVFHNVFSFKDGKRFDLGLYPVGSTKTVRFDRPGLSRIFCNIHPNMAAYVLAVESPHFAVSDASGAFVIPEVPAGTHPYHAWRASAPPLTGSIVVGDGASLEIRWPAEAR
jgi:plastocyanin